MHVKSQGTSGGVDVGDGAGDLRGRVVVLLLVCGVAVGVGDHRGRVGVLLLVLEIIGDGLGCCFWCWRSQGTGWGVAFGVGDLKGRVVVLLLVLEITGAELWCWFLVLEILGDELWCCCCCRISQGTRLLYFWWSDWSVKSYL